MLIRGGLEKGGDSVRAFLERRKNYDMRWAGDADPASGNIMLPRIQQGSCSLDRRGEGGGSWGYDLKVQRSWASFLRGSSRQDRKKGMFSKGAGLASTWACIGERLGGGGKHHDPLLAVKKRATKSRNYGGKGGSKTRPRKPCMLSGATPSAGKRV